MLPRCRTAGTPVVGLCDLLLKLYPLRQNLLSRHTSDVLAALSSSMASRMPPRALAELLGAVLSEPAAWEGRDVDSMLALINLLDHGFGALQRLDAGLCYTHLPQLFHALLPQLGAEHDSVRQAAAACLKNAVAQCIDDDFIQQAAAVSGSGNTPSPLRKIILAVESHLGARYQDSWELVLGGEHHGRDT